MKTNIYVVYDVESEKYEFPFVATSDREAISIFYGKIHSVRNSLDAGLGFKNYSYNLYCLGEVEPAAFPHACLDFRRLVAQSTFMEVVD